MLQWHTYIYIYAFCRGKDDQWVFWLTFAGLNQVLCVPCLFQLGLSWFFAIYFQVHCSNSCSHECNWCSSSLHSYNLSRHLLLHVEMSCRCSMFCLGLKFDEVVYQGIYLQKPQGQGWCMVMSICPIFLLNMGSLLWGDIQNCPFSRDCGYRVVLRFTLLHHLHPGCSKNLIQTSMNFVGFGGGVGEGI